MDLITKDGLLARGVFALLIGILCFITPIAIQDIIAYLIGIFLLVISVVTGGICLSNESGIKNHLIPLILSVLGVIVAILIFISPTWMVVALTLLVAIWLFITGIAEVLVAVSLPGFPHRMLLWISGFIGILFGILVAVVPFPEQGSLLLIIILGLYCLIFGIISIIAGLLMKKEDLIITA